MRNVDYVVKDGIKYYPVYSKRQWYVSRYGGVLGATGVVLNPKSQGQYLIVSYQAEHKKIRHQYIHRLVAKAFLPNPTNVKCVNHIDGDKINNMDTNLEWVTHKENTRHSIDMGLTTNLPQPGQQGFQCVN